MNKEYPNRKQFKINEELAVVEKDGYKFFRGRKSNDFQCVTCLNPMQMLGDQEEPKIVNGIRQIVLVKDCDCPPQQNE